MTKRFQISKRLHFSASHALRDLPDGHPCGRLHGHNYGVRIFVSADELDKVGFVVDFGVLKTLVDELDHTHLNDILPFNPTAELIAKFLAEQVCQHFDVRNDKRAIDIVVLLSETPSSVVRFGLERTAS